MSLPASRSRIHARVILLRVQYTIAPKGHSDRIGAHRWVAFVSLIGRKPLEGSCANLFGATIDRQTGPMSDHDYQNSENKVNFDGVLANSDGVLTVKSGTLANFGEL